jgi:hypothetical protein
VQPAVLELKLSLQPLERLVVTLAYDKVFLPIEEFPPDVSRGFDIPQGVLTVDGQHRVYTDAVLVMLPYPDQSMPFNVIAFVSTLFSLIIGNIFNSLYSTDQEVKDRINRGVVPNRFAGIFSKCKKKKKKQDKSAETTTKEIETKTENVK